MSGSMSVRRRDFLKGVAGSGAVAAITGEAAEPTLAPADIQAGPHDHHRGPWTNTTSEHLRFFNDAEGNTLAALVDTLIPEDEVGPSGLEAGVVTFIDREMAGGFGRGARMYM